MRPDVRLPRRRVALSMVACMCLCACGSVTPTQTYLRAADLRGINSVAVSATSANVSVAYEHGQNLPNPLQGWIPEFSPLYRLVDEILEQQRAGEDREHAASIQRNVGPAEVEAVLLQAFARELGKSSALAVVPVTSGAPLSDVVQGADAIVQLRVDSIGLRRIGSNELRLEVSVHAQMEKRDGRTLWSRDDRTQARRAYPLEYYKEHGVPELEELLRQIGTRLAAELVYAF
jgi:hypothetical protein